MLKDKMTHKTIKLAKMTKAHNTGMVPETKKINTLTEGGTTKLETKRTDTLLEEATLHRKKEKPLPPTIQTP